MNDNTSIYVINVRLFTSPLSSPLQGEDFILNMNQIRICTVVTGQNIDEFVRNLDTIQNISDLIELRIDFIEDLKIDDITVIKSKTKKPAIFTCRKQEEGGHFTGTEHQRIEILKKAIETEFKYVDIEYSTMQSQTFEENSNTKFIISYHNFKETPKYWELTKLIFDMHSCNADIIKIATQVNTDYDVQILFRALLSKKPEDNQIIIGMGEKGKQTRILGPLLGSYLTYASTEISETAPGQIHIEKLKSLYKNLEEIYSES